MRQFDVVPNPSSRTLRSAPFLVVLSSHHLIDLTVVIVAPLLADRELTVGELEVAVQVSGQPLVLSLTDLGSVERRILKAPVASLAAHEDDIRRALDRLFTGF